MIKLHYFNNVSEILTSDEILKARSINDLVKDDYNKAYAFGSVLEDALPYLSEDLKQDIKKSETNFQHLEIFKECLLCYKECKENNIIEPISVITYMLTVVERLYGKDSAILLAIIIGKQAKKLNLFNDLQNLH